MVGRLPTSTRCPGAPPFRPGVVAQHSIRTRRSSRSHGLARDAGSNACRDALSLWTCPYAVEAAAINAQGPDGSPNTVSRYVPAPAVGTHRGAPTKSVAVRANGSTGDAAPGKTGEIAPGWWRAQHAVSQDVARESYFPVCSIGTIHLKVHLRASPESDTADASPNQTTYATSGPPVLAPNVTEPLNPKGFLGPCMASALIEGQRGGTAAG